MLVSRRCCSSACGIATLLKSIQLGKNRSSERIGPDCPSLFCPAHAGLPCLVYIMDRARSNAKATAFPPFPPTFLLVTAGFVVAVVALEYSVAKLVAPFNEYRFAVP